MVKIILLFVFLCMVYPTAFIKDEPDTVENAVMNAADKGECDMKREFVNVVSAEKGCLIVENTKKEIYMITDTTSEFKKGDLLMLWFLPNHKVVCDTNEADFIIIPEAIEKTNNVLQKAF